MTVKDIAKTIEAIAPRPLQEDYDNAGLQVGTFNTEVKGVLVCLDITEDVIDEAIEKGCNLVVSHHPLIFRGIKKVSDATYQEKCIVKAIKNDIVLYSAHTNLDNAEGGVNHKIAALLGLGDIEWLEAKPVTAGCNCGSGLVGTLPKTMDAKEFLSFVKETFKVDCIMHNTLEGKTISKVALCGGAGSFLLDDAIAKGADCFLTGEMSYHGYFGHDKDILIAVIGHFQSEQYTMDLFREILSKDYPELRIEKTTVNTNPIQYFV